jgi:hypothetical protein
MFHVRPLDSHQHWTATSHLPTQAAHVAFFFLPSVRGGKGIPQSPRQWQYSTGGAVRMGGGVREIATSPRFWNKNHMRRHAKHAPGPGPYSGMAPSKYSGNIPEIFRNIPDIPETLFRIFRKLFWCKSWFQGLSGQWFAAENSFLGIYSIWRVLAYQMEAGNHVILVIVRHLALLGTN